MLTRAAGDEVQRFVELSKNLQFSRQPLDCLRQLTTSDRPLQQWAVFCLQRHEGGMVNAAA